MIINKIKKLLNKKNKYSNYNNKINKLSTFKKILISNRLKKKDHKNKPAKMILIL